MTFDIIKAIILGIVEGLTEFLPVSSTGHLLLVQRFFGFADEEFGRTPIGTYPLGQPRASQRYGIFIPIGYPTADQRKKGLTGGAVGVHGPDRRVKWLGRLVNTFDTSDGCVGLAKDEEMERIAKWVRSAKAHTIELR